MLVLKTLSAISLTVVVTESASGSVPTLPMTLEPAQSFELQLAFIPIGCPNGNLND